MADNFVIQDATREQARLRLALQGASGAGKSVSSLLVAKGMAEAMLKAGVLKGGIEGKIGLIDTERRSARLYAHIVPFKVIELDPPYSPERYIGALSAFETAGIPIVIIDQISHAWAGAGGLLEQKDKIVAGSNDAFAAFAKITPVQNQFIERLLGSSCHLILTMRAKTEWIKEEYTDRHGNRKTRPKRIGMAPVQRAGTEYEFTTLLSLEVDTNIASVLKDRTEIFASLNETPQRLTEAWGQRLAAWLHEGIPVDAAVSATPAQRAEAMVTVWEGSFAKCQSIPDLQRDLERAAGELAAFGDTIGGFIKKTLRDRLVAAKDRRKQELLPTASAGAVGDMELDPLEASMLEDHLVAAGIPMQRITLQFGIQRFSQLAPSRVVEVRDWITANAQTAKAS